MQDTLEMRALVDAAREVWIRRLIDHSRANSLLFFRDLKVGTLDLSDQPQTVVRLLGGERMPVDAILSGREFQGNDTVQKARAKDEARGRVRAALVAIQRKATSNREEKGIETLHFAMGMATWPAGDGGRPYAAPVLLLPARIEARGRGSDDIRLVVEGEPQINPVLLYVLEENHRVHIDPAAILSQCSAEDANGAWRVDAAGVSDGIRRAASAVSEFEVVPRAILGNFQFAKMAMVEDLKRNGDAMAASLLVAAVAGHMPSRQALNQNAVEVQPRSLDERPPSDDFLVLDADSTQHSAIVAACKGQNCVIHGPPGTGKSQTIANLIAQSVAEGRRMLFVAEKRAALDAVIKRLNHPSVGLGHLILDLHGASISRKEVMARLADTLVEIRHALPPEGAEEVHRQYEARRAVLNNHARRVNERRLPTGLSVNQIIGRLLALPTAAQSACRLRGNALTRLTGDRIDEVQQWIRDGAASPTLLLGTDPSPWNNATLNDGHAAEQALDTARNAISKLWPAFERALGQVVQQLHLRPPDTLTATEELLAVLRDVGRTKALYQMEIFSARPGELAQLLEPSERGVLGRAWAFLTRASYRSARRRLLGLRSTKAPASTLRVEALRAENVLGRWRALGAASEAPSLPSGRPELASTYSALGEATASLGALIEGEPLEKRPLTGVAATLEVMATDQRTAYLMPSIHRIRSHIATAGLGAVLDDFRNSGVNPETWVHRLAYIWLRSALDEALASDPLLASFNGRTHEQVVEEFKELDRERVRLAAGRTRRIHAERAIEAMNLHFDQANLIQTEARKRSRHIPLRQLFARAPDVLTRIAPCWVASPLSVSQLLDGGRKHFDLVIFDEASQILQEEAIPSLYRAEQVVVAGDRHQLPPTTFFATAVAEEDENSSQENEDNAAVVATGAIGGFESLLDTLEVFLPSKPLEWHYRSEDERLITFSNVNIYSRRLITFPSARHHDAIQHILIPHDPALGGQEDSASGEVEEVVRRVLDHAASRPAESLGVITMGVKHANRVQAALDRAVEERPDLVPFFSLEREERFFVKNLETVQGDERDAIILSIGYGKSANGDLPHRFGPLTQEVGYRRLNVAVTRAKRRMCTISSFSHVDVDLNRSGSRGVQLLKAYLEYAANGGSRLPETERAGEIGLNPFEADIRDVLEAHGVVIRPQFGASRYRIDLVAMHSSKAGRPVLAIECDGATYHSGASARDRDRLRQSHLERLGWRFHRIWSTDWFYSREHEIERLLNAYRDAIARADLIDAEALPETAPPSPADPPQQPLKRERGPKPLLGARDNIDQYSNTELRRLVEWVVSDGLLRTQEEITRDVFALLPFRRMGRRIADRLNRIVSKPQQGGRRGS